MTNRFLLMIALLSVGSAVQANAALNIGDATSNANQSNSGYLQCVPYARRVSGINIFGDAKTWWSQAEDRFARGSRPRLGAVLVLRPHGRSQLGHVAAVSKVVDSRTVLINHANWSGRGKIENNVQAVDVSPRNDWSEVRVWYGPIQSLGGGRWPVYGFIYNERPQKQSDPGRKSGEKIRPKQPSIGTDPIADIIAGRLK